MSSDMNNFQKPSIVIPSDQRKVVIDGNAVGRTLKKMAAPVFEFFTKEETPTEANAIVDYSAEIEKIEMKKAVTQRILNDSDPTARKKMNIVI